MELLQKAILLAAKIREDSYDKAAADVAQNSEAGQACCVDYSKFYGKSLEQAADEAAAAVGYDERGTQPIYLLLTYAWNDIIDWAKQK